MQAPANFRKALPLRSFANGSGNKPRVTGHCCRQKGKLEIEFVVAHTISELVVPARAATNCRRDELWQTTCFECFFRQPGQTNYWELNVSPSGHWNLYRFSDYRQGMQAELLVAELTSGCTCTTSEITVTCELPIDRLVVPQAELAVGLCCVLDHVSGTKEYWALHHPGDSPDFHHPEAMALKLGPI